MKLIRTAVKLVGVLHLFSCLSSVWASGCSMKVFMNALEKTGPSDSWHSAGQRWQE